jgi:predicted acylesterase/phospholipase RssA/Mrp family chromosome partitioning ATPase
VIFTFYSYKGGVGRSMALANVAELLVQRGLHVLMIDFDLEAPGLERFFADPTANPGLSLAMRGHRGVIDLLVSYRSLQLLPRLESEPLALASSAPGTFPHPVEPLDQFVLTVRDATPTTGALLLIPAGRRAGEHYADYAERVRAFNWDELYTRWDGEAFFDWLREQAEALADVVLIDSRTGIAELSGVTTFQLADVVVMFVAPNDQNLEGCRVVAESLRNPRLISEGRQGRDLLVLPVPSRVDAGESDPLTAFARDFEAQLGGFVPPQLKFETSAFTDLQIPYKPRYAYRERVAVREPEVPAAADLIAAYTRLTTALVELAPPTGRIYEVFHGTAATVVPTVELPPDFSARPWVAGRINDWLRGGASPMLLVTGPLGTGKTALFRWLAHAGRALGPSLDGVVAYAHFCDARDYSSLDAREFVIRLATRLAAIVPGYADAVTPTRHPGLRVDVRQVVSATRPSSDPREKTVEQIVIRDTPAFVAFDELVSVPLSAVGTTTPLLVLIDGPDETLATNESIFALLKQMNAPDSLRFVISSAADPAVLDLLQADRIDLIEDAPPAEPVDAVRAYALRRLRASGASSSEAMADRVAVESAGNFLVARCQIDELLKAGVTELKALPEQLAAMYRSELGRLLGPGTEEWERWRTFFGVLAVARQGVTAEHLAVATDRSGSEIEGAVRRWSRLLVGPRPNGPISLFHPSLADFLLTDATFQVHAAESHRALATSFIARYGTNWMDCEDVYALRYTFAHLLAALRDTQQRSLRQLLVDAISGLVLNGTYFLAKVARLGPDALAEDVRLVGPALSAMSRIRGVGGGIEQGVATLLETAGTLVGTSPADNPEELLAVAQREVARLVALEYARAYEDLRQQLRPSNDRTGQMNLLVDEVRALANRTQSIPVDVLELLEGGDGERIVGLAVMQVRPDPACFNALLDTIGQSRSAFEQYHALLATRTLLPHLSAADTSALRSTLRAEEQDVRHIGVMRDATRSSQIVSLLGALEKAAVPVPDPVGKADLVLAGGGLREAIHVGVLSVLEERGYALQRVAGTSAGAVVAAFVAAGVPAQRLQSLLAGGSAHRAQLGLQDLARGGRRERAASTLFDEGVYDGEHLRTWVEETLRRETGVEYFGDLRITDDNGSDLRPYQSYRLLLIAADISRGRLVRLPWDYPQYGLDPDAQLVADAVHAAATSPYLFRPVRIRWGTPGMEESLLVDASAMSDVPVEIFDRTDGIPARWPTFGVKLVARSGSTPPTAPTDLLGFVEGVLESAADGGDQVHLADPCVMSRTIFVETPGTAADQSEAEAFFSAGRGAAERFFTTWDWKAHQRDCATAAGRVAKQLAARGRRPARQLWA